MDLLPSGRSCDERADDDTEPTGTVTPRRNRRRRQHLVSLKDLDAETEDRAPRSCACA